MITEALINFLAAMVEAVLFVIPTIPISFGEAIAYVLDKLNALMGYVAFFVPVDTLMFCLKTVLAFHIFKLGFKFVMFIISVVRGVRVV